jgi:hypothetical protein
VGPLIKLRLSTLIDTPIIVIIKLSIAKVIKVLNFNYIFIPGVSSKGFKELVELYIINLTIFELVDVI